MARVINYQFHNYVVFYKTPCWPTRVRDSPHLPDEVGGSVEKVLEARNYGSVTSKT